MSDIILFDIDYTLLNTSLSKENCRSRVAKLVGVSMEDFLVVEKGYTKKESGFTDFRPNEYISYLSNYFGVGYESLSSAFFNDDNFRDISYPEVRSVLESLLDKYRLGIFSEGFENFQVLKLHKSDLLKYFDQEVTFIFQRKLTQEALESLPKECFILDDNYYVVEGLSKTESFKPIWLNRKTRDEHPNCKTVFDLTGLRNVLES